MNKILLITLSAIIAATTVTAQKAERSNVRAGNKFYNNGYEFFKKDTALLSAYIPDDDTLKAQEFFNKAEIAYRKGIEVNPRSTEGIYNLANVLYRQGKYPEAIEQYKLMAGQGQRMIDDDPDNIVRLAQVFHNEGNVCMKSQDYQKSIETYKQSLRLNPSDDETRYNLALAQKLLAQQQQQQQQDQQQDKDNKEEQQDQKQDQQQDQKQQDQQQQQQQQDKQQQTQDQQQQNEQLNRDNAQQMLDALLQDEKDTQEKVKKIQQQKLPAQPKSGKRW
ncbi:MAG: tetratricopeptide repeat protein [Tannerella sp.]|nr:tetratricopeptide repeat protein [Tannerella sp.]